MKIECACGVEIFDQTDALPHKAHLIPDEDWFEAMERLEGLVEAAADGRITKDEALHRVRLPLLNLSRKAWQCRQCGRLYLDGPERGCRPHRYAPESEDDSREVLRGTSAS